MNNRKMLIRILAGISLLLFLLPFFQGCSDEQIKEGSTFFKSYENATTDQEKEIAFEQEKKDMTLTGYDLDMLFDPALSGFTVLMAINITLFVCFLRKHYQQLFLCLLNVLIVLFYLFIAFLQPIGQIRYGIYLYLLNAALLFYFVYKEQETRYKT